MLAECRLADTCPPRGSIPLRIIDTAIRLVTKAGSALRAVPKIFDIFSAPDDPQTIIPSASGVRSWLLRLGLFALREPLPVASDWLFLIDHSVQIGTVKACVIVGVRQSRLPYPQRALRLEDLSLLALIPVETSTGEIVAEQLEQVARRVGIPRGITSDHGSDVKKGGELFATRHPETTVLYDIAHHGASVLKKRLEAHPRWSPLNSRLGQIKARLLQTSDAYLVSPSPRPKARYMNIGSLLKWCRGILRLLDRGSAGGSASERAEFRYGWLRDARGAISEWSRWEATICQAVSFVRTEGLRQSSEWSLLTRLVNRPEAERHRALETELFQFVRAQSSGLGASEVLVGSTEVLESLFGKWKALERQESKSGMTSQLLSLGTLVGEWPNPRLLEGLSAISVKNVKSWCSQHLPASLQSQRQLAFTPAPL